MRTRHPAMAIQKYQQVQRAVLRLKTMQAELAALKADLDEKSRDEYLTRTGRDPLKIGYETDMDAVTDEFWQEPKEDSRFMRALRALSGSS